MAVSTVSDRALTPPHSQSLFVGCFRKAVGYPKSACFLKCCFTSAQTARLWDGESGTSTYSFTQLLNSESYSFFF